MSKSRFHIVQLYPTDNLWPRWREMLELYRQNRRYEGRLEALWHALKRQVVTPHLPPLGLIDNLGLVINTIPRGEGEE